MDKYKFERKLGQKVLFWVTGEKGTIVKIEPYYTIVKTVKCYMAGTPTTICEVRH